jgi:hypothetical protein
VRPWADGVRRAWGASIPLTGGNVIVAAAATVITIAGLVLGLRYTTSPQATAGSGPVLADRSNLSAGGVFAKNNSGPLTTATATPKTGAGASAAGARAASSMSGAGLLSRFRARGGPGQVVVSWRVPGEATDRIRATIDGSDGSHPASTCTPTVTGCTFANLVNGVEYTVTVALMQGSTQVTRQTAKAIPYPAVLASGATRLWFDPADPDSLVTTNGKRASGTGVRHLLDRSGSGADAGPSPARDAPTVAEINGHPVLNFRSTSGMSFAASSLPTGASPSTVYAVAALDSRTPEADCFAHLVVWGTPQPNGIRGLLKGCSTSMAFADTYDTWAEAAPTLGWRTSRTQIMRADFTAETLSVWMDGVSSYAWHQPPGAEMDTGSVPDGMLGGAPWNPAGGWQGSIAEIIVLSSVPTQTESSAIMQYLERKWGL